MFLFFRYKVKDHVKTLSFHSCHQANFKKWEAAINRKDFQVSKSTRVCSNHFIHAKPTESHPIPSLFMRGKDISKTRRTIIKHTEPRRKRKRGEILQLVDHSYHESHPTSSALPTIPESPEDEHCAITIDHTYHTSEDSASVMQIITPLSPACSPEMDNILSPSTHHISSTEAITSDLQDLSLHTSPEEGIPDSSTYGIPFDITHIQHKDHLMKIYTGLTNHSKFSWIFNTIKHNIPHLQMYKGATSYNVKRYQQNMTKKPGPERKLKPENELLLTLMKIKLDLLYEDLAFRFDISVSLVSQIISTWIPLLSKELRGLIYWPSQEEILHYYPKCFEQWSTVRAIIDCTEITLQRPSIAKANSQIYSNYKSRPTAKVLVACTPGGTVSFISKAAGGAMSDKQLVEKSGILRKFEPMDICLADRGFNIQELLVPFQVKLIIPPFLKKKKQLDVDDAVKTKKVANSRIHVERVIGRIKEFQILQGEYPLDMLDLLDNILIICAVLVNLQPPLVPME